MTKEIIENIVDKRILSITRNDDDEIVIELDYDCFIKLKAIPDLYESCHLQAIFEEPERNLIIDL